ncbi:zinc-binding dehydrogenase [Bradyrhizobium roseum]|uniref:zinc-binding dehydrogenase n=1 Tax=Bradyrhizobium roseum TaxID=3056648 RepID=UPI0026329F6A|nr:zinc-binding dehydrogenase [Bradyrhizobium roseus]WKA31947.1 zinc-binding dehydrogenase [Bradyrhizobium roseus]
MLTGTRNGRLAIGRQLGADRVININDEDAVEVVKQLTGGIGADYVVECAGSEATIDQAILMTSRGGKICLAAFPHDPVTMDLAHLVKNNIYVYGIRGEGRSATRRAMALMAEKRFDATKIHTTRFRWPTCRRRYITPASASRMRSRWWLPTGKQARFRMWPLSSANGHQRPSNFGSRFSMNALMPSCMSWVLNSGSSCR